MMVFDPPDRWWIRVGQETALILTEASATDILAELEEIWLRINGYASQATVWHPIVAEKHIRMMTEATVLHLELARRIAHGFENRES